MACVGLCPATTAAGQMNCRDLPASHTCFSFVSGGGGGAYKIHNKVSAGKDAKKNALGVLMYSSPSYCCLWDVPDHRGQSTCHTDAYGGSQCMFE